MKRTFTIALAALMPLFLNAQNITVRVETDPMEKQIIAKELYGQFSEHLGSCIYGGLWVGKDSKIPNIDGYRKDVFEALKELKVPVMRWPGGCFADDYHWRDGIGPQANRPHIVNNNWGGTLEDNSFGTHEFLNLCEMLGCEPYISGNVGSGTVEEMSKWVEYMTAANGHMADERAANGRKEPWKVKYFGIGNEAWGCGGNMTAEYYSNQYRAFSTYLRDYHGNKLYKIASGASDYDYDWTETLMKAIGNKMDGVSLHYYSVNNWNDKGSATNFSDDEYYEIIGKTLEVEPVIARHCAIMDSVDPEKKIGLLLDEWGTWFNVEPGTNPGHLYQQNTMRDAIVAGLNFNIFHRYTDRLKMANIAQVVNVLQAMLLTNAEGQMIKTPTYYVFKMYNVHQDAQYLPVSCNAESVATPLDRTMPLVSATASRDAQGDIHVSLVNPDLKKDQKVTVELSALKGKAVSGEIITAKDIHAYNDFGKAESVNIQNFKGFKVKGDNVEIDLPAKSVVTITIK